MISVIVPVYQAEKYLKKCVDSILRQTYTQLEVLLIDDGSTDKSGDICDYYAEVDSRVIVKHKKNEGVAAARNSGMELATGEYITFVDSDDYIEPIMYEEMMSIARKYNCDVVMCDCLKESLDYKKKYSHNIRGGYYDKQSLYSEYYNHLLMMENVEYPATISNWLLLFRRNLESGKKTPKYLEGIRFSEDLLFGAQLLYVADSFYYMKDRCFYHYVMNPTSATHVFKPDKWNDYIKLIAELKTYFGECKDFDFSHQLNLVTLFFVYNAIGDIKGTSQLQYAEKVQMCKNILDTDEVRSMFKKVKVNKLPITMKLKIITYIYKYRIGLKWWIKRNN